MPRLLVGLWRVIERMLRLPGGSMTRLRAEKASALADA